MTIYKPTPEQQALIEQMLQLRRTYMDMVDTMFEAIKPTAERIRREHGPREAVTYLYAVCPDCVPRVLMIHALHLEEDQ